MKIFVSWSGSASKEVAKLLKKWIPRSLSEAELFVSDVDIKAGDRWSSVLGRELSERQAAIVCLTPQNADSTWVNFEAGAISKVITESRVIPFLHRISISSIDGPLTQFQAKNADKLGYFDLLKSINELCSTPKSEPELNDTFDIFWPKIEDELSAIKTDKSETGVRDISDVLDNVIFSINDLRDQVAIIEGRVNPVSSPSGRLQLVSNFFDFAESSGTKEVTKVAAIFCINQVNSIFAERVLTNEERAFGKNIRTRFSEYIAD